MELDCGLAMRRATSCSTDIGNTGIFIKWLITMHISLLQDKNSKQINVWYHKNSNSNTNMQVKELSVTLLQRTVKYGVPWKDLVGGKIWNHFHKKFI